MSQATESPTPLHSPEPEALHPGGLDPLADDFPFDPPAEPDSVRDLVFRMEDAISESLCLSDALLTLMEGRRGTLRVKPGTVYFLASEVQGRLQRLNAEWCRLFKLTAA